MHLEVDGLSTYAYTGGKPLVAAQPALVFVHGAGNDHSVWALQSRYFAHHGWNVIAVDLPGHGRSEGGALASVEAVADWLVRLQDALALPRASLAGHSMGALASLECAARYPDRIGKIVLLGAAAPMTVSEDLLASAEANDHLAFELINGWAYSPRSQFGGNTIPGMWMAGGGIRLLERSRPGVLHTDLLACNRYGNGLAAAAKVEAETLLVLGGRDIMAPARNGMAIAQVLKRREVLKLPSCGHVMMSEEPDQLLDAMRRFLAAPTLLPA
jgi:pimeloyl-ACP methyl ester carboxylesterase